MNDLNKQAISKTEYPVMSKRIQIEETGDDVIIYDKEKKSVHMINSTSFSILKTCNGSNKIEDIVRIISEEFKVEDLNVLNNDIIEIINEFYVKEIIE